MTGRFLVVMVSVLWMTLGSSPLLAAIKKIQEKNGIIAFTLSQPLDHANPKRGSFEQRFYLTNSAALGLEAPILLETAGVFTADSEALIQREQESFAKPLGARMVVVEHRFTGKSIPDSYGALPKWLPFFSSRQVVEDLRQVQKELKETFHWTGKWFAIGGSHTGSIALLLAQSFPESIDGVYASSPSHLGLGAFTSKPIDRVGEILGDSCTFHFEKLVAWVEKTLDNAPSEVVAKFAKEVFDTKASVEYPAEVLFAVMNLAATSTAAGQEAFFCSYLEREFAKPSVSERDLLRGLARPYKDENGDVFLETESGARAGLKDGATRDLRLGALWQYLLCNEWGSLWVASKHSKVLSQQVDEAFMAGSCKRVFDIDPTKIKPNHWLGRLLAEKLPETRNVLIVDGWRDPWSLDWLIPQEKGRLSKTGIYYRSKSGGHCSDRVPRNAQDEAIRKAAIEIIKKW